MKNNKKINHIGMNLFLNIPTLGYVWVLYQFDNNLPYSIALAILLYINEVEKGCTHDYFQREINDLKYHSNFVTKDTKLN